MVSILQQLTKDQKELLQIVLPNQGNLIGGLVFVINSQSLGGERHDKFRALQEKLNVLSEAFPAPDWDDPR